MSLDGTFRTSRDEAMTKVFAERSVEKRREGEALIREADNLACQSWNERMWSDDGPIDPSPTIDQAINGGFPWPEIKCSRCQTPRDVDLCTLRHREGNKVSTPRLAQPTDRRRPKLRWAHALLTLDHSGLSRAKSPCTTTCGGAFTENKDGRTAANDCR
jgi:hypothetical protein